MADVWQYAWQLTALWCLVLACEYETWGKQVQCDSARLVTRNLRPECSLANSLAMSATTLCRDLESPCSSNASRIIMIGPLLCSLAMAASGARSSLVNWILIGGVDTLNTPLVSAQMAALMSGSEHAIWWAIVQITAAGSLCTGVFLSKKRKWKLQDGAVHASAHRY